MKKEERLENIKNMENIFNELKSSLDDAEKSLKRWEYLYPMFKKLMKYYDSEQWKKDYDDVNNGKLIPEGPHGILSEDAIYNFYEEQKGLSLEIMEFINKLLKW